MLGILLMLLAAVVLTAAILIGGWLGAALYAGGFGLLWAGYATARLRGVR